MTQVHDSTVVTHIRARPAFAERALAEDNSAVNARPRSSGLEPANSITATT
jgi:hypothetical protein